MQFPEAPFVPEPLRGGLLAIVCGAFLGEEPAGQELLRPMRALGPGMDTFAMVPPIVLGGLVMDRQNRSRTTSLT